MFLHQTLNSVYSVWGLVSFVYFLFFLQVEIVTEKPVTFDEYVK